MKVSIAVHPATKDRINKYLQVPAHAVILLGPAGTGRSAIARNIAAGIIGDESLDKAVNDGRLLEATVEESKSEISIETIRSIIRRLSKKSSGSRIVLIENAGLMSQEAQNALLKTLEQPGAQIHFILIAASRSAVLSTIASRAVVIDVKPVGYEQAKNHYSRHFSETEIEKAWQLSEGRAAALDALLKGETNAITDMIERAKQFLRIKTYERLLEIDDLSKDRQQLRLFLEALQRVLKALHHGAIKSNRTSAARLLAARKDVNEALKKLETNASAKLVQLELVVNLTV